MGRQDFVATTHETPWTTAQVVAIAAGFGLGWVDASNEENANINPRDLTIRLTRADAPISGRIVDLEGRPVAGATIRPEEILEPEKDDLSAWIGAEMSGPGDSYELKREYLKRKLWSRIGSAT